MALVNVGEIATFPFGFEPVGWAYCDGRTLPIEQYEALYGVIGAAYGGDGETTFALPNLNDRVTMNSGQGPGTSNYVTGQQVGSNAVALTAGNLPTHFHVILAGTVTNVAQKVATPGPTAMLSSSNPKFAYVTRPEHFTPFSSAMCGTTGGSAPHDNCQPSLTLNFCIALNDVD